MIKVQTFLRILFYRFQLFQRTAEKFILVFLLLFLILLLVIYKRKHFAGKIGWLPPTNSCHTDKLHHCNQTPLLKFIEPLQHSTNATHHQFLYNQQYQKVIAIVRNKQSVLMQKIQIIRKIPGVNPIIQINFSKFTNHYLN